MVIKRSVINKETGMHEHGMNMDLIPHSHSFSPSTLNMLRVRPFLSAFTVSSSSSPSASSSSSASRSLSSSSSELDSPSSSSLSPHSSLSSFLPCRAMISARTGCDSHSSEEMVIVFQFIAISALQVITWQIQMQHSTT